MADTTGHAKIPTITWAQRNDVVYLTICLEDCKDPAITLTDDKLVFSGKGGTNKELYEITVLFYKEVNPQESKYGVQARNVQFVIRKKETGPYWPQLLKNEKKDEDESDDEVDKNMDLAEPPDEEEDSDDEDLPDLE
ncbi:WOS2-like protein [Mya arenaria]|uniref:WOS2-like protein n=1 Tax=Mya arenaria TaxID=6604 RepID=A0ABY7DEA7_MYAAR|nr:WOS2-like protein [Mya arenaria]